MSKRFDSWQCPCGWSFNTYDPSFGYRGYSACMKCGKRRKLSFKERWRDRLLFLAFLVGLLLLAATLGGALNSVGLGAGSGDCDDCGYRGR